jgi:hypothetical protein
MNLLSFQGLVVHYFMEIVIVIEIQVPPLLALGTSIYKPDRVSPSAFKLTYI